MSFAPVRKGKSVVPSRFLATERRKIELKRGVVKEKKKDKICESFGCWEYSRLILEDYTDFY